MVGASSGIGRATAIELGNRGARVALAARRADRLEEAAHQAQGVAVVCDVRDPAACESALARALEALGGLDALVYCVGMGWPGAIAEIEPERWREIHETNFLGAVHITRAAISALADGRALYLSSISAREGRPRPGMAPYITSKIALEKLVEAWQVEHPEITFTRVTVGDTMVTEFGASWPPETTAHYVKIWAEQGYLIEPSTPEQVAAKIADVLDDDPTPVVELA